MASGLDRWIWTATAAVAGVVFASPGVGADVFKWKNANGVTVYSDRAPAAGARRVAVQLRPTNAVENRARLDAERASWAQADANRAAQQSADANQRQELQRQIAEQCRAAQRRSAQFSYDAPQYRINEQLERVYFSAEEIDRERAESRQRMAQFCGSAAKR